MTVISTTAGAVARKYRERIKRWEGARQRGLRKIVVAAEKAIGERASGSGAPGDYPIPMPTGFLRRSTGSRITPGAAMVFNTAIYAGAMQRGYHPYGNPHAPMTGKRPFFDDGVATVDAGAIMAIELERAL